MTILRFLFLFVVVGAVFLGPEPTNSFHVFKLMHMDRKSMGLIMCVTLRTYILTSRLSSEPSICPSKATSHFNMSKRRPPFEVRKGLAVIAGGSN